jgi:tight adherence protein B
VRKLLKDAVMPEVSRVYRLLAKANIPARAAYLIRVAGKDWNPLSLIGACAAAFVGGFVLGMSFPYFINGVTTGTVIGLVTGAIPYLYVKRLGTKRLAQLEELFPDALDFLARSVRAGHSFSISLSMVSDNVPEPLAMELTTLFSELNLGASLATAFENFTNRIPLLDFRFFTSAVILQRQTGGNISEILGRLAHVIRERFRLKGEVKAASAHGKMTAGILTLMPLVTTGLLSMVAPTYISGMLKDPDGKMLLIAAGVSVVLGNYCIKRIIKIKV